MSGWASEFSFPKYLLAKFSPHYPYYILFVFLFLPFPLLSQFSFQQSQEIDVLVDGQALPLAWAGGLNASQFSNIDLDKDGILDLFIFDRTGNRIIPLIYRPMGDSGYYEYGPAYTHLFPSLQNWVLLRDFNEDGLQDIFTNSNEGLKVYKQTEGDFSFLEVVNPLMTQRTEGEEAQVLLVASRDIPAILDVDGDKDLDILAFDIGGNRIEFHRNMSMDLYGHSDSLVFELADACWGKFEENAISNDVFLGVECESRSGGRHAGSTILALDLNGDEQLDVLLGDISFTNIVALLNGGTSATAQMISQNQRFPTNAPVNLPIFPAVFHLDLDKDGRNDLLVSPNTQSVSENSQGVWWYKNLGTNTLPSFELVSRAVFQEEMIEVGEGAYPVAFDENGDGLMDLVVGNYGYYDGQDFPNVNYRGRLALFRNIGTLNAPEFERLSLDWASLANYNLGPGLYPTFGDLDGDENQEMLIGRANGEIVHFERENDEWLIRNEVFENIDVGDFATPQIVDIDRDSLLDLVIGERSGNLNYYRNVGTKERPSFTLISDMWGNVRVSDSFIPGYSIPHIFEHEGHYSLVVGREKGDFYFYNNIENDLLGVFPLTDSSFADWNVGIRSAPCLYDWNGDGYLDFIGGNYAGGLGLLMGEKPLSSLYEVDLFDNFNIFPNPFDNQLIFKWETGLVNGSLLIRNVMGKVVYRNNFSGSQEVNIPTAYLTRGLYLLEVIVDGSHYRKKLIKN